MVGEQPFGFLDLPDSVLTHIAEQLDAESRKSLSLTCRSTNRICRATWECLLVLFPEDPAAPPMRRGGRSRSPSTTATLPPLPPMGLRYFTKLKSMVWAHSAEDALMALDTDHLADSKVSVQPCFDEVDACHFAQLVEGSAWSRAFTDRIERLQHAWLWLCIL